MKSQQPAKHFWVAGRAGGREMRECLPWYSLSNVSALSLCVALHLLFRWQVHHLPQDRGDQEHTEPGVAALHHPRESSLQWRLWQVRRRPAQLIFCIRTKRESDVVLTWWMSFLDTEEKTPRWNVLAQTARMLIGHLIFIAYYIFIGVSEKAYPISSD